MRKHFEVKKCRKGNTAIYMSEGEMSEIGGHVHHENETKFK